MITRKIKKILKEENISQVEFAKKLGLSESAISRYLAGKRQISIELLVRITKLLKVSADYLLGLKENRK